MRASDLHEARGPPALVEQEIEDRHGTSVALADEKALSQSSSPYRTVGTLAEYAAAALRAGG